MRGQEGAGRGGTGLRGCLDIDPGGCLVYPAPSSRAAEGAVLRSAARTRTRSVCCAPLQRAAHHFGDGQHSRPKAQRAERRPQRVTQAARERAALGRRARRGEVPAAERKKGRSDKAGSRQVAAATWAAPACPAQRARPPGPARAPPPPPGSKPYPTQAPKAPLTKPQAAQPAHHCATVPLTT
jgi:hypothetical protein